MELEVEIDSLAFGGRGVARADGFVVFVSGALPGDRVLAEVTKAEALRRGAHDRAAAPRRRPRPGPLRARRRALPRRALAGPPLRAPAGRKAAPGRGRAAADRRPRRLRDGGDRPGDRTVALPQQARVLLRRGTTAPTIPRLPRPRPLGPDRRRRGLQARLRSGQRGPQRRARMGAMEDDLRLRPPRHKQGVLRNLVVREGRRTGQIQTRLVTSAARFRGRRSTSTRRSRATRGQPTARPGRSARSACARSSAAWSFEMSHGAFFQTNTEMAERLYAVAAEFAGLSGRERVFDLFCGIGTIGLTMAAHAARSGAWRSSPRRSPTPSATPSATGSRTPGSSPPAPAPACGR